MMKSVAAVIIGPVLTLAMLAAPAQAATLPGPALVAPNVGAYVDQPVFQWNKVPGAASYDVEVALDDQFVTITDKATVAGTTYTPTRTYQAKTMYWHVRTVASDGTPGEWGPTGEFTRRWTNVDEPAGTEVDEKKASRVEKLRTIDGGNTPAINHIGFTWDPVPGAAYYEVQFSTGPVFQQPDPDNSDQYVHGTCWTPHTTLTPYYNEAGLRETGYIRRDPLKGASTWCNANSPIRPAFSPADWSANGELIVVNAVGPAVGDKLLVKYAEAGPEYTVAVQKLLTDPVSGQVSSFVIANDGAPAQASGSLQWSPITLNFEPGQTYYARVRAVDLPMVNDYPVSSADQEVYGLWSDQRSHPGETPPDPLWFTPTPPSGSGTMDLPAKPSNPSMSGSDLPVLRWTPVTAAAGYKVVIALDRDFTDRVGVYYTRSDLLVPEETFDDNGPAKSYYWFALPCSLSAFAPKLQCDVPDKLAVNSEDYVGRFTKRSVPMTGLSAKVTDDKSAAHLRWSDALTAAQATGLGNAPGGVAAYEVQVTATTWAAAQSVVTDNLMLATTQLPSPPVQGTYRWRVRPLDGQQIPLAWALGPDFAVGNLPPSPPPLDPPPTPSENPNYDQTNGTETTTKATAPGKPGKPDAERLTRYTVRLKWRTSSEMGAEVTGYRVFRATDGQHFTQVQRVADNRVKLKAKRGKNYWFYIVADSAAGQSEPSRTTRFRMPR